MDDVARAEALVSGRVQGVGFRDWARRRAGSLGLHGSATNLADGRVAITVEGPRPAVEELLDALYGTEPPGRVHGVDVAWSAATGETGFRTG